jgi:hypothetical protein
MFWDACEENELNENKEGRIAKYKGDRPFLMKWSYVQEQKTVCGD